MKLPPGTEKWGIGILAVLSLLLVRHLVSQFQGTPIGDLHVAAAGNSGRIRGTSRVAEDLAHYDPVVHLEVLKQLDARPLPDAERSPFEYVGGAVAPKQAGTVTAPTVPVAPPPPPVPPPLPLKAMGYNELPGGGKEAFVNYEDNMQLVHEGDVVGTRFKILKITPTALTVEDETDHQTHEMPFPQ